jgi:hypothetical protein
MTPVIVLFVPTHTPDLYLEITWPAGWNISPQVGYFITIKHQIHRIKWIHLNVDAFRIECQLEIVGKLGE